jgi:hypothetical protein
MRHQLHGTTRRPTRRRGRLSCLVSRHQGHTYCPRGPDDPPAGAARHVGAGRFDGGRGRRPIPYVWVGVSALVMDTRACTRARPSRQSTGTSPALPVQNIGTHRIGRRWRSERAVELGRVRQIVPAVASMPAKRALASGARVHASPVARLTAATASAERVPPIVADQVTHLSSRLCGCVARTWPAGTPFLSSKTAGPGSCDAPGHGARD